MKSPPALTPARWNSSEVPQVFWPPPTTVYAFPAGSTRSTEYLEK